MRSVGAGGVVNVDVRLSEQDHRDSLPYVCYERSLFHLVKRTWGLRAFEWLYADRYLGFDHADSSEALRYSGDGLGALVRAYDARILAETRTAIAATRDLLAAGWGVRVMADTVRPDGSHYVTSTLIEALDGADAIVTKTNAAEAVTRKRVPASEFFQRVPADADGRMTLEALRLPSDWIDDLNARDGLSLFRAVLVDTFGYTIEDELVHAGTVRVPSDRGFAAFADSVAERTPQLATDGIPASWHLRLNKHVADKVRPVTNAWRFICADAEIATALGGSLAELLASASACDRRLDELSQAFSFAAGRPGTATVGRLLSAIRATAGDYRTFQALAHTATLDLIGASA